MLSQRSEEGSSKGACEREPGERGGGKMTSGMGRDSVAWTGSVLLRGGCQNVSENERDGGRKRGRREEERVGSKDLLGIFAVATHDFVSL